ncbi:MAG: hypothetical protein K0R93_2451 [Anaerosolibacter sp.]|jgi:hypothetical protein|nr:hypothetical protein [Anaerosolibacter sp.]
MNDMIVGYCVAKLREVEAEVKVVGNRYICSAVGVIHESLEDPRSNLSVIQNVVKDLGLGL